MQFLLLLAGLGLALAHPRPDYIINGDTVTQAGKWPWQGSLRIRGSHTCGLSLIGSYWGVTAAHCVGSAASYYSVQFGSNDRYTGGVTANAGRIIKHEHYGSGSGVYPNDIAVIQFDRAVSGSYIQTVPLSPSGGDHAGNSDCWITGWGHTVPGTTLPWDMQEARVNVYTNSRCKWYWGSNINDGHVCIGGTGSTSCQGDSGGPLVCRVNGRYELVGATSWGPSGCLTIVPAVYSRIAYFRDWIRTNTGGI